MRVHSKTLTPQGCPKCFKFNTCEAAIHDFAGVEAVALKCPACGNIWRAALGIQIRNPDGTLVEIGGDAGDSRVAAFGGPT